MVYKYPEEIQHNKQMRQELTKMAVGMNESELETSYWLHAMNITAQLHDIYPQLPCHQHGLLGKEGICTFSL